jgi:hypothetical protein
MEKEFVPYEQAVELKELGFDEPCFGNHTETDFYDYKGGVGVKITKHIVLSNINGVRNYNQEGQVSAPTFSQAFRWLYQKLGIEKGVMPLDIESQQLLLKELIDKVSSKHLLV